MKLISLIIAGLMLTLALSPAVGTGSANPWNVRENAWGSSAADGNNGNGNNTGEGNNTTIVYPFDTNFQDYISYQNLTDTLHRLASQYPNIMKVYDLTALTEWGTTQYGRTVWAVKISDNVSNEPDWYDDPNEEDVVIVGCHHAREWMSVMVPLYYIYYLTYFYGKGEIDNDGDGLVDEDPIDGVDNDGDGEDNDGNPDTPARMDGKDNDGDGLIDEGIDEDGTEGLATYLVNHREIWIVPLLNPDGYEYDRTISHPGSSGGWRKNCRDQSINGGKRSSGNGKFDPDTDGVDLNRNYPYQWNRNEKGYVVDENGVEVTSDDRYEGDSQYRGPDDDYDQDGDAKILGYDPVTANPILDPDGVDEDWWDNVDNDGDGLVDEDRDGGFTEAETQSMDALMKRLDIYPNATGPIDYDAYHPENHDRHSNVVAALSYHSYSAMVIWPWGYTHDEPPHEKLFEAMGHRMMDILDYASWKDSGGYLTSGEWGDWMYGTHGVLSFTIELNTAAQGGFHPQPEMIIPTARMNLGANLFITDSADKASIAKENMAENLDVGLPEFRYEQKYHTGYRDEDYEIKVEVENYTNLVPGSVKVWYRAGNGPWHSSLLTDTGEGHYEGKIPGQKADQRVYFYFEGKDVRGPFVYSKYGEGTPYSYFVDDIVGYGNKWVDAGVMVFMMALIYGMVWGGFFKAIQIANRAEEKKKEELVGDWD